MKNKIFLSLLIMTSITTIYTNSSAAIGPGDDVTTYICQHVANGVVEPPFWISPRPPSKSCHDMYEDFNGHGGNNKSQNSSSVHYGKSKSTSTNKDTPVEHDCQFILTNNNA